MGDVAGKMNGTLPFLAAREQLLQSRATGTVISVCVHVNMLACNYVYKTVFVDTYMHIHFIHIHALFLTYITLWGKLCFNCIDGETEAQCL